MALIRRLFRARRMAAGVEGRRRCSASVPNERALPFSPERFPYHLRHYTARQFEALLRDAGLEVLEMRSQHDADAEELQEDRAGLFLVAVCRRAQARD